MAEYSRTYGTGRAPKRTVKTRVKPGVVSDEAREKQTRATELRAAGASYGEIAKVLGYHDASGARKAVEAAIRSFEFEETRNALRMDMARLDEYAKLATHRLRTTGDMTQIDRLLRIMEKRHWLLGVNPGSLAEAQSDGTQKTVGGMQVVVASSERTFVRSMMRAVGQDPDSPEGRAYLAARGLGDEKELPAGTPAESTPVKTRADRVGDKHGAADTSPRKKLRKKKAHKAGDSASSYNSSDSNEVVDAEIVEDKDSHVRETARAISIKPRDEEQVAQGVKLLDQRKI